MILRVDVLLDGTARAAQADRVVGHAVALDEALLHHERRLAAHLQVVVNAGDVARRVRHCIAERESVVQQHSRGARVALRMTDPDAALEAVDQATVPGREVRLLRVLAERSQHGQAVDEAVDRAPLPPHDVVDGAAVHQGGLGQVGWRVAGRKRLELPAGRAVYVVDAGLGTAVLAPADDIRLLRRVPPLILWVVPFGVFLRDGDAHLIHVVDQRLPEASASGRADERLLLGAGEDRPRDRMIRHGEVGLIALTLWIAHPRCKGVFAHDEAVDKADEGVVPWLGREGSGDVGAVELHPHLVEVDGAGDVDPHQRIATADHVGIARQDRELETAATSRRLSPA